VGWGLLSAAAFGAVAIVAKLSYKDHVEIGTILAVRLALGAAAVWMLAKRMRVLGPLPRGTSLRLFLLGATCFYGQGVLIFESVQRISAATTEFLLYTYPAMVAVASVTLFHERLGRAKLGALLLSLCGLGLLLGGPNSGVQSFGGAMALAAAVVTATYLFLLRSAADGVHPLHASAIVLSGSACAAWAAGAATGSIHAPQTGGAYGWLLLHALLISVAVSCSTIALQRMGPTRTAVTSTFEPVTTVCLATVVLGPPISAPEVLGGVLVIVAAVTLAATSSAPNELDLRDTIALAGRRPGTARERK
jgi:drug/metabolite transporter (DMT)-like permease